MRIVIAPDKFKGVLSASDAAKAMAAGVTRAAPDSDVRLVPMADGGDGTLDCLLRAWGGRRQQTVAPGPLGEAVTAPIGLVRDASTAIVELATVSGYALVPPGRLNPLVASTFGLGRVLRTVIETGVENILLALGGSATVDGGVGLMQGLGLRLYDDAGREIPAPAGGGQLGSIARIAWHDPPPNLESVQFTLAVDVLNPLCGPAGAARVFGPQKGADAAMVEQLDRGLAHWADVLAAACGRDLRNEPGMGAAGGAGLPLMALGQATIQPGVDLVMDAYRLTDALADADLVLTGEGRLDAQSLMGKVVGAVARLAKAAGVPCIALVGATGPGAERVASIGLEYEEIGGPMEACAERLAAAAERVVREEVGNV